MSVIVTYSKTATLVQLNETDHGGYSIEMSLCICQEVGMSAIELFAGNFPLEIVHG